MHAFNPKTTPVDKAWVKVLGDTIAILNKVLQAQKGEELGENELEEIFGKVPEQYVKVAKGSQKILK